MRQRAVVKSDLPTWELVPRTMMARAWFIEALWVEVGALSALCALWVEVCALSALCALWVEVCALSALCTLWVEVCALSALCALWVEVYALVRPGFAPSRGYSVARRRSRSAVRVKGCHRQAGIGCDACWSTTSGWQSRCGTRCD